MKLLPDTRFPNGTTVGQRVGLVVYWFGLGIAILSIVAGAIAAFESNQISDANMFIGLGFAVGFTAWLIGRAFLFICADR